MLDCTIGRKRAPLTNSIARVVAVVHTQFYVLFNQFDIAVGRCVLYREWIVIQMGLKRGEFEYGAQFPYSARRGSSIRPQETRRRRFKARNGMKRRLNNRTI